MTEVIKKARKIRASLLARLKRLKISESVQNKLKEETPTQSALIIFLENWNGKCYYFGSNISLSKCHVDHKLPLSRGGDNCISNLAIACPQANLAKGDMTEDEFKKLLKVISKFEDKGFSVLARLRQGFFVRRKK